MKLPDRFYIRWCYSCLPSEGSNMKDGNKGKVAWDDYLKKQGRFSGDAASDFYHKYPIDLKFAEIMESNGIRISICLVLRIFPNGVGQINKEGVEFYHKFFRECKKRMLNHMLLYITLIHQMHCIQNW